MFIKEIELYNFRIYKGQHIINLDIKDEKNIFIVSGRNGFGKTTFLMSLVWCLYGKQMHEVDDLYNKEISDQGGYSKYISGSLNRLAKAEGETNFHVSITFCNVDIADILPCKEIKITRRFNTATGASDQVEILVDGYQNELTKEVGPEIFIRDFLLPKEIAKFFFFDAEKIVTLAEINTPEQRRKLSEAYSEVLGIKKYEDLKKELENFQIRLRQESASSKEKTVLIQLQADVKTSEVEIEASKEKINEQKELRNEKTKASRDIQEKLIRAGSSITVEELQRLREKEEDLNRILFSLQDELKNSFDIIPFAIAGGKFLEVSQQLESETSYRNTLFKENNVNDVTNKILTDLLKFPKPEELPIDYNVERFYADTFTKLIRKHFFADTPIAPENFKPIHEYSDTQINEVNALLTNLKLSFKESFKRISSENVQARNELNAIRRKIKDAESNAEDPIIADYRKKKEELDKEVIRIEETIGSLNRQIGEFTNEKTQKGKRIEEIAKKLNVAESNKEKDQVASRLIAELKEFIVNFKEEKKKSLEAQILKGLETFMHKKGFIRKVRVDIIGDDIDIQLFNNRKEEIKKESLSKGEQQMYATSLLRGLVEESNIQFPVFIDSPMQKFDEHHASNIVKYFYPEISDQVVIFPLINKELTEKEYELLYPYIAQTFLIDNVSEDMSEFIPIAPDEFFTTYNAKYNHAN